MPKTKRHPKSSQASATPVTDGKHVIVSFGSEGLYAYDFDGKLLWKKDLGVLNSGWFFDPDYEWGIGSSPIIYKNMVIVQCDIQRGSFIAAFDTATGKEVWRTQRDEIPSWSTPTIFEANGKAELVTQATTFTRGYDPMTGKELWKYSGNSEIAIPTPIVGPGLRRHHQRLPRRAADRRGQARRHRRHHAEGAARPRASSSRGAPTAAARTSRRRSFTAISSTSSRTTACWRPTRSRPASGSTRSGWAAPAARSARPRSPPTARSTCRAKTATSSSSRRGPAYELLAKNPVGEVLMATPAISDGLIIFRGLKNVFAIKAQ